MYPNPLEILILILAMHSAPSPLHYEQVDGHGMPAEIPPYVATAIIEVAYTHGPTHDTDPLELALDMAGMLAAENRSRRYDPATVGRYVRPGATAEGGLWQLTHRPWVFRALRHCTYMRHDERTHHIDPDALPLHLTHPASPHHDPDNPQHTDSPTQPCAFIPPNLREMPQELRDNPRALLYDPHFNAEAAALAILWMQQKHSQDDYYHQRLPHWATLYRCRAQPYLDNPDLDISQACLGSTNRARAWMASVRSQYVLISSAASNTTSTPREAFEALLAAFSLETDPPTLPDDTALAPPPTPALTPSP